jgi:hypothetical protein
MLTLLFSYGFPAFWRSLGTLTRLLCIVILISSIYCLYSALKVLLRIHSLRKSDPSRGSNSIQLSLAGCRTSLANIRQVRDFTFYLFGFMLFANLQTIAVSADHSKIPLGYYILQNFFFECALAQSVFLIFIMLHLIQWFVASRVASCSRNLDN